MRILMHMDGKILRPGFDVVIQAETGWMYMNGEKNGPPGKNAGSSHGRPWPPTN